MASKTVLVGGSTSFPDNVEAWAIYKYDTDANIYPHGHHLPNLGAFTVAITGIAIDTVGQVYCCSWNTGWNQSTGYDDLPITIPAAYGDNYSYPQWTVRKLDPNGYVVWQANHKAACHDLVIDASGNVYIVGDPVNDAGTVYTSGSRTGFYTTRKYDNDGNLTWSADHGGGYIDFEGGYAAHITVDSSGNVYTIAYGPPHIVKYNSSGIVQWSTTITASPGDIHPYDIAVDASGNVYVTGKIGVDYVLAKYDSSGVFVAYGDRQVAMGGGNGKALCFDSASDIILATNVTYGNFSHLYKYDSDLALVDTSPPELYYTGSATGIVIDDDDVVYVAASRGLEAHYTGSGVFGNRVWTTNRPMFYDDEITTLTAWCVALAEVETPPLKIPLDLGIPTWQGDFYTKVPGLPITTALGIPNLIREYVGSPLPIVYTLTLTGSPNIELPLSSFSIRSNSSGTYLSVVSPGSTLETVDAIEARSSGQLIIRSGYLIGGYQQLEILVTADLTGLRYDAGGNSLSISLDGSVANDASHNKTRTLTGISYRNETTGARRVRCAVDPYLRIGDIADLGGAETLTVGGITIYVSATQAVMEVSE